MTIPDYQDKKFQDLLRKELGLSKNALFESCGVFSGTEISGHCIGTVHDGDILSVLIRCSFVISGDAVIFNLDLPGAPRPHGTEEEVRKAGLDPRKVRLVGVCLNASPDSKRAGQEPEIWIIIIPY